MNVQRPNVPLPRNQFNLEQVKDLANGGVAVSDGKGTVGVLKKPTDKLPAEWAGFKGQLPDFRPISKAEVVGALWREAGLSGAKDAASRALGDRLKEILKSENGSPAAAANAYLTYLRHADSKSAVAVAQVDAKHSASGLGGSAQSKADLTAFISRQAFAATYREHISSAVTKATQAAHRDPALSEKFLSGTLTPREVEALARIGMDEVRASVTPSGNDDE